MCLFVCLFLFVFVCGLCEVRSYELGLVLVLRLELGLGLGIRWEGYCVRTKNETKHTPIMMAI